MNTLIIDTREPEWLRRAVKEAALKEPQLMVIEEDVQYGDYIFVYEGYTVGVERKSIRDLLNTVSTDRFRPQMAGILTSYTAPFLLIEGGIAESKDGNVITDGSESRFRASSLHGLLLFVQEQRIRLLLSPSERVTPQRLMTLYNHFLDPNHKDLSNDRLGVLHYKAVPGMEMLMGIPGVGWKSSKLLMEHFGSVSEVCNATTDQLEKVKGVGRKTAQEIYKAFNQPYLKKEDTV